MDIISHALEGSLTALVGLQKKYGLIASLTMVTASVLPDLDMALILLGPKYFFQYHRHPLTHSLGGSVLLSFVLTAVICTATPLKKPWLVFGISISGMILHLLSDLLTPWPIPLFFPFSSRTYSFDLIYFVDPVLLFVMGIGFFALYRWPAKRILVVGLTLLIAAGYLGFRVYGKQAVTHLISEKGLVGKITALPHGFNLVVWDVIVQEGKDYSCYIVDPLRRNVRSSQEIYSSKDEEVIEASKSSDLVQSFIKRARFPVVFVTKEEDLTMVEWRDVHLMIGGGAVRGVVVLLNKQLEIIDDRFELNSRKRTN